VALVILLIGVRFGVMVHVEAKVGPL